MSAPVRPDLEFAHPPRPPAVGPEAWGVRRGVAVVAVALGALLLTAPAWADPGGQPPVDASTSRTHALGHR